MATETDLRAVTQVDRPAYTFNTNVQGPIGSLAQGHVTVGPVQQQNAAGLDLPELISLLQCATPDWSSNDQQLVAGAHAAIVAEAASLKPDAVFLQSAIGKIGSVASKVTETVATQALLAYIKAHGWTG